MRREAANQFDQPASERMSTRHGLQLVGCKCHLVASEAGEVGCLVDQARRGWLTRAL